MKDAVAFLENDGFQVHHDPSRPGQFTVDTKDGPVTWSPQTEGAISQNDVDAAKNQTPPPLPDHIQNDPRVLGERARAARELASEVERRGDATRAGRCEPKRIASRRVPTRFVGERRSLPIRRSIRQPGRAAKRSQSI